MNPMAQTGLNKLCGLFNIIRCNGGLTKMLRQLYRVNDAKSDKWIEEALNTSCTTIPECAPLAKSNPEEALMTARLFRWFNYLTKDCFLLVPAKRLESCDEELSDLHCNASATHLIPPLNFWDCFSIAFPPPTIQMTQLFSSESSDKDTTRYYLAITKNNGEDPSDADNIVAPLPRTSVIGNTPLSRAVSDSINNSNVLTALREQVPPKNLALQKPKISLDSWAMRPCTTKTCNKAAIFSNTEKLGSLRKKHIDCTSELEIECSEPRKCFRRRFGSKKGVTTAKMDVGKREEKDKRLQIESKLAEELSKVMDIGGEESKNSAMENMGKQNDLILDSKDIAANNKVINPDMDTLSNGLKLSCASECKHKKQGKGGGCGGGQEDGCGDRKKKPEGCGGEPKKGGKCGGGCKDEGTCVPNLHRKPTPCGEHHDESKDDEKDSKRNIRSKAKFNKKMKETRIKYKIEHCRSSKITWGRSDFNKRNRKGAGDICGDQPRPADGCDTH